ncbi:MAG: hypothetical protein Q9209_007732 [Squamulea sp. 1 TL-2023]
MSENMDKLIQVGKTEMLPDLDDFPIDEGILAKFSPARLHVKYPDGQSNRYFLKTAKGKVGKRLMEGEFHAISALHNVDSLFVPKPHAWGKRSGPGPERYFFLLQYVDMSDRFPDPN